MKKSILALATLATAFVLCMASSLYSWENTFINNTNETITIIPMYLRTFGPITATTDVKVLKSGERFERTVGGYCTGGIIAFKGDRKREIDTRLIPFGATHASVSAVTLDALIGKLMSYNVNPSISKTDLLNPDLITKVPGWQNRCKNWDFTITKDAAGRLVGTPEGHY